MIEQGLQDRLRAYLRLTLADGVGPVVLRRLVEAFGSPQEAASAPLGRLRAVDGIGDKTARAIAEVTDSQVDDELAAADAIGAAVVCLDDPTYPRALSMIPDPPPVLYVRGRLEETDGLAVGVVGSRRCTHYGFEQAERFGQLLARAGYVVVSGGARGIDTAAHQGTLRAGGRTLAVMGCGLSHNYPAENRELFERIVAEDRGALISELPVHLGVQSRNFPRRNRIISGLSLGTLVVEAARRSGAMITAQTATEQGRIVLAVPGRVDSPMSQGTNELIREGCTLVQGLEDVLEALGPMGSELPAQPTLFDEHAPDAAPLPPGLDAAERKLYETLAGGELRLDDLVRQTSMPAGQVASAMTMLVLKGAARQKPGNVFVRVVR